MLHIKIHQLHQRKFKIAQIAKELKISVALKSMIGYWRDIRSF